jgi:endonuclease/exonuclease/phosphatase family metal-dependent hydrolase
VVIAILVQATHRSPAPSSNPSAQGVGPRATDGPNPQHTPRTDAPQSVGSATGSACVPQNQRHTITVLTYNIHSALGHGRGVQLATIADEIRRWHVDVAMLQEVDRFRGWTGGVDMPSVLAARLDYNWTFGDNVSGSNGSQYGTAILSRYPIVSSRNTALPDPPGTQQRGLLHVQLDVDGSPLSVYNTHLEHTSPSARLAQIRQVMGVVRADPLPVLLGGDLNATPGSPVLATARTGLTDPWAEVGSGQGRTVPKARIDYQLHASGDGTGTLTPMRALVLASQVSDHSALWARYQLKTGAGRICVPLLTE